jgi:hypothetical protein
MIASRQNHLVQNAIVFTLLTRADRGHLGGGRVPVIARETHLSTERPVRHGSNATRPSSSPVPNQVTSGKRTLHLAISCSYSCFYADIRPSRLFGSPQTRTERTGNNGDGTFCSVETPPVSTCTLSSQSVCLLTSIHLSWVIVRVC